MKLQLFEQIVELNQAFDQLIMRLAKMESVRFFQLELIQHARSDVEIARVYANREFFDSFEEIVENEAKWAYRFQCAFDEKLKDRDDIYLEVRESEDRGKRRGLSPRVVILPGWDMDDEDRLDERGAGQRNSTASKRACTARTHSKESRPRTNVSAPSRVPKKEGRRS